MITSPDLFDVSLEELEALFNAKIDLELLEFKKMKNRYIEDPLNKKGSNITPYIPEPQCTMWLNVPKSLVPDKLSDDFKTSIIAAGWNIVEYKWLKDEKTGSDQLYIYVDKK